MSGYHASTSPVAALSANKNSDFGNNDPPPMMTAASQDDDALEEQELYEDEYDPENDDDNDSTESVGMTIQELLYSSSSYYAIAKPVTLCMILAALVVVHVNSEDLQEVQGAAMASAYQAFDVSSANNTATSLALSLANAFIMICFIGAMTFVIVCLYKMRFMKCLIGYMIFCSTSLLGFLGGHLVQTALQIYQVPLDQLTFFGGMWNFAVVGVLSIFYGQGIPTVVTQGYLVCTAVILAWHLSFFDAWTAWSLLFMLALYDLCAVLSTFGPLKALVEAMSEEDAPEMPGLLFEAELPPEARKPQQGNNIHRTRSTASENQPQTETTTNNNLSNDADNQSGIGDARSQANEDGASAAAGSIVTIPLAIAKVYRLPVISLPPESQAIMHDRPNTRGGAAPLLDSGSTADIDLPEEPTVAQLKAMVTVQMPANGGRLERVKKRGKRHVYLERDRHGEPKRLVWVDRNGKVFAEMRPDDEDDPDARSSIRLGLGDFIFYSVLVSKAAQYSFATFAACMLVILAGLGGTLLLLAVYHHALPALPISILLGIFFYIMTRLFMEPWIEAVMAQPYYV